MAWKYRKKAAEELAKRLPEQIKKAVGDLPVNEGAKRTDTKKEDLSIFLFLGRGYWTRTSDLAPPRRVRYQLR